MNKAVLHSMTDAERRLVAETEPAAIADLDEDELLELHTRIRRARGKYVKNYRRAASAKVGARGSRGKAFAGSQRDRDKAEVFELSLARVSRQVAKAAAQAAAELKEERLAAARGATGTRRPGDDRCGQECDRHTVEQAGRYQDDGRAEEGRVQPCPGGPSPGQARRPLTARRVDRPPALALACPPTESGGGARPTQEDRCESHSWHGPEASSRCSRSVCC